MIERNVTLGELFKVGSSKRVLKSQWKTEGVPFYRGREITRLSIDGFVENELFISENDYAEYSSKYGVPTSGDIVITAIGTIGNTYIVREEDRFYFKDASVLWLKKTADVSSEFVNLWLKSPLFFDQLDRGNGATVDTLTIKKMQSVQIDLPPLPEQKRIVAILDEAFAGIDAAVANTEKNLANARELFESYLNAVFTQKGDGWVEKKLGEVCVLQRGFDLPKRLRASGEYPLVSSSGIIDCHSEAKVKAPGVATGRSGSIGSVFFIEDDFWPLNTVLYVKEFYGNDPQFIYHLLKKFDLKQYASGSGVPTLNRNHVHSELVWVPEDGSEQRRIVDSLNALWEETQRLESVYQQKLDALTELKQSILQKAFAGELTTLPEKSLEEAVA